MKDLTDSKTADLLSQPKRRGRPPTGEAMTAAERKRRQRQADRNRILESMSDGKPVTVTGLIEAIGKAAHLGLPVLVMQYAQQLADRIQADKKP